MNPDEARATAEQLFRSGHTCAQAVLCTFCDELGIPRGTAMQIAASFGAGMGRLREVCGTVSGMFLALGLYAAPEGVMDTQAKAAHYGAVQELARRFRARNGSIICRELLGLVPMGSSQRAAEDGTPLVHITQGAQPQERTPGYYKKRPCPALCGEAAAIFAGWLQEQRQQ